MSYLILNGRELSKKATAVIKKLCDEKIKFSHVLCRGNSGVLMGSLVASRTKTSMIILRKNEQTHGLSIEHAGLQNGIIKSAVFVDDLIDTGDTLEVVVNTVNESATLNGLVKLKAVIFYNQGSGLTDKHKKRTKEILKGVPAYWI